MCVAVVVVEGWLRPGYDSRSMYLSELALGPRGLIVNIVLVAYGALLFLFARGVAAEFPDGSASRWGPRLLRIIGFTAVGLGLFVMDPLPTPLAQLSAHGWLHALFGIVQSYAVPISCFVFLKRFREERQWRALAPWTLTAGVLTVALVVILKTIVYSIRLAPGNALGAWGGLVQRLALFIWIGWQFAVAVRLLALTRERAPGTSG